MRPRPSRAADAATEGTDYATVADLTLTIAAGVTSGTAEFSMDPTQDAIDEGTGETLSISGTTAASGLSVTGTQMTITDDDATPTLALTLSKSSITEDRREHGDGGGVFGHPAVTTAATVTSNRHLAEFAPDHDQLESPIRR